jgi:cell division protein FtsW
MTTTTARRKAPTTARRASRVTAPSGRRSSTFLFILGLVVALNLIGLVMVLSASSVNALTEYGSSWYYFERQLLWVAVGAVLLVVAMRMDYHRWATLSRPLLIGAYALLVLVLVPGIGVHANGSTRWLGYGPISIQPSEFAKLAVLVFTADLLSRRAAWIEDWRLTLKPVLVVLGVGAGLLMLQPNLGTTLVLGAIVLALLFVAGTPLPKLGIVTAAGALCATVAALGESYRRARVLAFLDPWADPQNTGYQTIQSLVGIASGGIFGVGLGASKAKWGYLPYAHTDFIFAIISEELGLVGAAIVVGLFVALVVLGVRTALRAPDRFGTLLATGVTAWLAVQAFVNIGAVIAVLPITGVPLPFVSFGGSSLLATMIAAGILLNVARQCRPVDLS